MVFTTKTPPKLTSGEVPIPGEKPMRTPIRVKPDEKGDQLVEMSRIDYGRVYTVEHNVKARAFGWVHEDSKKDLDYDFRDVFMGDEGYRAYQEQYQRQNRTGEATGGANDDDEDSEGSEDDAEGSDHDDEKRRVIQRSLVPLAGDTLSKAPAHVSRPSGPQFGRAASSTPSAHTSAQRTLAGSQLAQVPKVQNQQTHRVVGAAGVAAGISHAQSQQGPRSSSQALATQEESEEDSSEEEGGESSDEGQP